MPLNPEPDGKKETTPSERPAGQGGYARRVKDMFTSYCIFCWNTYVLDHLAPRWLTPNIRADWQFAVRIPAETWCHCLCVLVRAAECAPSLSLVLTINSTAVQLFFVGHPIYYLNISRTHAGEVTDPGVIDCSSNYSQSGICTCHAFCLSRVGFSQSARRYFCRFFSLTRSAFFPR